MYRKTHQCGKESEYIGIVSNDSLFTSQFQEEQNLFQNHSFVGLSPSINNCDEPFVKDFESMDDLRFDPTNFSQLEDVLLPLQSERFLSNIFWEFDECLTQGVLSSSELPSAKNCVPNISLAHIIPDVALNASDYQTKSIDSLFNESNDSFNDSISINRILDNFCINTTPLSYNNDSLSNNLLDLREYNNPIPYCRKTSCPIDDNFQSPNSSPIGKKSGRKPKPFNLTEDEKSILKKEGVVLPENVHTLTKTEERHIKQVKRRIKNKISAAESRKRKKDYLDGLEGRVQQTTSLNCELQKRVGELEKRNFDLLTAVKRMRTYLTSYVPNIPTSNSALLLFIIAFSLFSIPSWISISNNLSQSHYSSQTYVNVGSRTLLTQSFSNSEWLPNLRSNDLLFTRHGLEKPIQTDENIFNLKPPMNVMISE